MKKFISTLAVLFAFAVTSAYAGVAPNTGASAAARSGAKIAEPKDKNEKKEQGAQPSEAK